VICLADGAPDREATLALYAAVGWTAYTDDPERLLRGIAAGAFVTCA